LAKFFVKVSAFRFNTSAWTGASLPDYNRLPQQYFYTLIELVQCCHVRTVLSTYQHFMSIVFGINVIRVQYLINFIFCQAKFARFASVTVLVVLRVRWEF